MTVNLEDAVLHEQKLWVILEGLRNHSNVSLLCDDWYDVTETSSLMSTLLLQVLKDRQLKALLLKSQKIEHICIGVVQFYHMLAYE